MANLLETQIILDGPRNFVIKVIAKLDTSDIAATTIIDPSTMSGDYLLGAPNRVRLDRVEYDIEDTLGVDLTWDATTQKAIAYLDGRGVIDHARHGGLNNNAGAGITGKVKLATSGYSAGSTLSFTLVIECVKQWA